MNKITRRLALVGFAAAIAAVATAGLLVLNTADESLTKKGEVVRTQEVAKPEPATFTREELLDRTNSVRAKEGLPRLMLDPVLDGTAQKKCEDMARRDDFDHGSLESYWIMAGRRQHGLAENLARSNESASTVVDKWVASPTHYANLVGTTWGHVGFGICSFERDTLIVQHFSD